MIRPIFTALALFGLIFVNLSSFAQEKSGGDTVTVPTPSFSNPSRSASNTTIPKTGTQLREKVRTELFGPASEDESKAPTSRPTPKAPSPGLTNSLLDPSSDLGSSASDKGEEKAAEKEETKLSPAATEIASSAKGRLSREERFSKPEVSKMEMLEKIGDQLSLRMRSIRSREDALSEREKALIDREKRAEGREQLLRQIEESLIIREGVVRKREQLPPAQSWRGRKAPSVYAQYAAVIDGETMQFYHKKNALDKTPVASTQKLLTALIICEGGDLDEYITIAREATLVEPTKIGVLTGEKYTRRQLLTALLVRSGNDIAAALAIDNAGSAEAFAKKMNIKGQQIGLVNSNFKTPSGLPAPGQYSCARDVAIIAFEAYQNPDIRKMVSTKYYTFVFNSGKEYPLRNTNRLMREWEYCNGMKTGFTYKAGKCLVASAVKDGKHRISVVIKDSNTGVITDSKNLLQWALGLEMLGPITSVDQDGSSVAPSI